MGTGAEWCWENEKFPSRQTAVAPAGRVGADAEGLWVGVGWEADATRPPLSGFGSATGVSASDTRRGTRPWQFARPG